MQAIGVQIAEKDKPAPAGAPSRKRRASNAGSLIKDRHKRASRTLGFALTLNDAKAWQGASFVFTKRLHQGELAGLAFASLRALEPANREPVFCLAHWGKTQSTETPPHPSLNPLSDARLWASNASREQVKAFALASFEAMSLRDRVAFLAHIAGDRAT